MADVSSSDGYAWFTASVGFVACGLLVVVVAIHARHTWFDLAPENDDDRKSISHRRHKPKRTREYKRIVHLTLLSMICYFLAAVAQFLTKVAGHSMTFCKVVASLQLWMLATAKLAMYATFFMRLRQCYKELPENLKWYTKTRLRIIFAVGATCFFFSTTMWSIFMREGDEDDQDAITTSIELVEIDALGTYSCYGRAAYVPTGVYGLTDVALAALNLWLFRKPLKESAKGINENYKHDQKAAEKFNAKLLAVQKRTRVLVYVAIISSLFVVFVGGGLGISFMFGIDMVVNCVCMAFLQGAYYDDHTNNCYSYKKLCHLCAKCCDPQGHSMRYQSTRKDRASSHVTAPSNTGVTVSDDTLTVNMHIGGRRSVTQSTQATQMRSVGSNSVTQMEPAAASASVRPMTPVAEEDATTPEDAIKTAITDVDEEQEPAQEDEPAKEEPAQDDQPAKEEEQA